MNRRSTINLAPLTAAALALGAAPARAADPAPAASKNPTHKAPIPTPAELKSADAMLHEVYKDDIAAANTPSLKTALAGKILAAAAQEPDLTHRYALLIAARDQAFAAADPKTMIAAIEALDKDFDFDTLKLESESLVALSRQMRNPDQRASLAAAAELCAHHAVAAENFEIARQLAELAVSFSAGGNLPLVKEAAAYAAAVRDFQSVAADARRCLPLLAATPTDPEANFRVGKYRCLYQGKWKEGLVNLAMGNDKKLGALAQKDLAAPSAPDGQMEIGDAWWDAAQDGTPITKSNMLGRARFYYLAAVPQLQGLAKARVEKRLRETEELQAPAAPDAEVPSVVLAFLNQIPAECLPAPTDKAPDLKAKMDNLKRWMNDHPQALKLPDARSEFTYKYIGATTTNTSSQPVTGAGPVDPMQKLTDPMRIRVAFQERFDFKTVPCVCTFSVSHNITGPADPEVARAKALRMGENYKISTRITSLSITFLRRIIHDPVTNAPTEIPEIGLEMICGTGELDAQLVTPPDPNTPHPRP